MMTSTEEVSTLYHLSSVILMSISFADEFIADVGGEGEEDDVARRAADHARFDRRERELDDQDLAKIAEDVSQRYRRTAVRYSGDMNEIPQRLLMPSVHDANLWQIRVKVNSHHRYIPMRSANVYYTSLAKSGILYLVSCEKPLTWRHLSDRYKFYRHSSATHSQG